MFDFDLVWIWLEFYEVVGLIVDVLYILYLQGQMFFIVGYIDVKGICEYNLEFLCKWVVFICEVLVIMFQVLGQYLFVVGFGEEQLCDLVNLDVVENCCVQFINMGYKQLWFLMMYYWFCLRLIVLVDFYCLKFGNNLFRIKFFLVKWIVFIFLRYFFCLMELVVMIEIFYMILFVFLVYGVLIFVVDNIFVYRFLKDFVEMVLKLCFILILLFYWEIDGLKLLVFGLLWIY